MSPLHLYGARNMLILLRFSTMADGDNPIMMKKVVNVTEVSGEGLVKLLGERVTLFCAVYIYTGTLIGVNEDCVLLEDASIVYETGPFNEKNWKDAQKLGGNVGWYVQKAMIESFGILKE
jgi:hypothetical protein